MRRPRPSTLLTVCSPARLVLTSRAAFVGAAERFNLDAEAVLGNVRAPLQRACRRTGSG